MAACGLSPAATYASRTASYTSRLGEKTKSARDWKKLLGSSLRAAVAGALVVLTTR